MGCGGSKDKGGGREGPAPLEPQWTTLKTEEVVLEKEVGETAHAKLHRGTFSPANSSVLVKAYGSEEEFKDKGLREALVLSNLKGPNLIKLIGITPSHSVVLEATELGSLREALLKSTRELKWAQAMRVAEGVAAGLCCIHGLGARGQLIHGNLNSGTVMLNADWTAKLSDFENSHQVAQYGQAQADDVCLAYAPPEVLTKNKVLVAASDVYSFGILLTSIFGRSEPFVDKYGADQDAIYRAIFKGERPELPDFCPAPLVNLVQQCTVMNVIDRPDAKQVKKSLGAVRGANKPDYSVPHPDALEVSVDALC